MSIAENVEEADDFVDDLDWPATRLSVRNLSTGFRELARYGRLVEGDIEDPAALRELFSGFAPDAVMHFAARALVGESVTDPYYGADDGFAETWADVSAVAAALVAATGSSSG